MNTSLLAKQFRLGQHVTDRDKPMAMVAFQTLVIPHIVTRLGVETTARMIAGTVFMITIEEAADSRDELADTSPEGVRIGIGAVNSGRILFANIAHNGRIYKFRLNQSSMPADELHRTLTVREDQWLQGKDAAEAPAPPPTPAPVVTQPSAAPARSVAEVPPPKPVTPTPAPVPKAQPVTPTPPPVPRAVPVPVAPPPLVVVSPQRPVANPEVAKGSGSPLSSALDKIMAAARRQGVA